MGGCGYLVAQPGLRKGGGRRASSRLSCLFLHLPFSLRPPHPAKGQKMQLQRPSLKSHSSAPGAASLRRPGPPQACGVGVPGGEPGHQLPSESNTCRPIRPQGDFCSSGHGSGPGLCWAHQTQVPPPPAPEAPVYREPLPGWGTRGESAALRPAFPRPPCPGRRSGPQPSCLTLPFRRTFIVKAKRWPWDPVI